MTDSIFTPTTPPAVEPTKNGRRGPRKQRQVKEPKAKKVRRARVDRHPGETPARTVTSLDLVVAIGELSDAERKIVHSVGSTLDGCEKDSQRRILALLNMLVA